MLSNSVLISWMVRAVHLFRNLFVKMEFVKSTSVLFNYLRYIKKKRARQALFSTSMISHMSRPVPVSSTSLMIAIPLDCIIFLEKS